MKHTLNQNGLTFISRCKMDFRVQIIVLSIIFFGKPVHSTCLVPAKTKACQAVFNPDAMKSSCCPPMNQFVQRIGECQKKSNSDVFSCSVSVCVVTKYGLLTDNEIDENKARTLLKQLDKENPASKPLNDEIYKNCLKEKYKQYVTSDLKCDTMKYQVCAYVNYLNGCKKFNTSPSRCETLAQNVATCKPVLQQYLKQINSMEC